MEFQLTTNQAVQFNKLLPKGYRLELSMQKEKKVAETPNQDQGNIAKISSVKEKVKQQSKPQQKPQTQTKQQQTSIKQRRSELELLDQSIPTKIQKLEKRVTRERKPEDLGYEPKVKNNEVYRKCMKIINQLKRNPFAGPFLQPVDPIALNIPDYFEKIKEPMDLGTVENNLRKGQYTSIHQLGQDVRRIWSNSFTYNVDNNDMLQCTKEMSTLFEKVFEEAENSNNGIEAIEEIKKKVKQIKDQITTMNNPVIKPISKPQDKPMSMQEKQILGRSIRKLDPKYLRGVMNIVADGQPITKKTLEFDIENLPTRIQRELERYVKQCLSNGSKSKRSKAEINVNGIQKAHEKTQKQLKDVDDRLKQIQESKSTPQPVGFIENQNTKGDSSSSSSDSESTSSSDEESGKEQNGFGSMLGGFSEQ